jgi:DNA-directed RNA polymerase II subunit RPB1
MVKSASISALQLTLLNEEQLKRRSVVTLEPDANQITRRNTMLLGSVLDPRLGSTQPAILCSTCGASAQQCQGHIGSLRLKIPCAVGVFVGVLHKIMQCVCWRCSRLLISESTPKVARLLAGTDISVLPKTLNELSIISQRFRVCGGNDKADHDLLSFEDAKEKGYCCAKQPIAWIKQENCLTRPIWFKPDQTEDNNELPSSVLTKKRKTRGKTKDQVCIVDHIPIITGETIYTIIKNISPTTSRILGFTHPHSPITSTFTSLMIVPPTLMRPSRSIHSEDDLTVRLRNIVRANDCFGTVGYLSHNLSMIQTVVDGSPQELSSEPPYPSKPRHTRLKKPVVPFCLSEYFDLQRNVAGFADNRFNVRLENDYGRERSSVRHRFASTKSKHGRVRGSLMGKRGDYNARGVASPNTYYDIDEVGIPLVVCMRMSYAEHVTSFNYDKMTTIVRNGPKQYPGANLVIRGLKRFSTTGCFGGLRIGDVVMRHLQHGDLVILNRQPSLHRFSLMVFKVVPTRDYTIQAHLNITRAFNLDFDGDEMNIYVLFNDESRAEAQELMAVGKNLFKDGLLLVSAVQHACLGSFLLTRQNMILSVEEVSMLIMAAGHNIIVQELSDKWIKHGAGKIPGRMFFQWMIPCYLSQSNVNKKTLNQLLSKMCRNFWLAQDQAIIRMSAICRILDIVAANSGCSMSLDCCNVEITDNVKTRVAELRENITQLSLETTTEQELQDEVEDNILKMLDQVRDFIGDHVIKELRSRPNCDLLDIVESGAKGNLTHITQNAACVGSQLDVDSKRPQEYPQVEARDNAAKRGFVESSFMDGLTALESFHHLKASRVGLVGTAVSVSETGYTYRRISKCLEDLRISFDNSVRDAQGNVILSRFGFSTEHLIHVHIRFMNMTRREVVDTYRTNDDGGIVEVKNLLDLRTSLFSAKNIYRHTLFPVDFDMIDHFIAQKTDNSPILTNQQIRDAVALTWVRLIQECYVVEKISLAAVFFDRLSTADLRRRNLTTKTQLQAVLSYVAHTIATNVMCNSTPIGLIVSQSLAEPLTQMQLDRFHHSGEASALTGGVNRIKELLNLTKRISTPSMEVYTKNDDFNAIDLVQLRLTDIISGWTDRCIDTDRENEFRNRLGAEPLTGNEVRVLCFLKKDKLIERRVSPRIVAAHLVGIKDLLKEKKAAIYISFSNLTDNEWWVSLSLPVTSLALASGRPKEMQSLFIYHCIINDSRLIAGVLGIRDFFKKDVLVNVIQNDELIRVKRKVIVTLGSNLAGVAAKIDIDKYRTTTNDIMEIYKTLGIDAACNALENELVHVMLSNEASVSRAHIKVIAAAMCIRGCPYALTYAGMCHAKASALKLSLFERSLTSFITAGVNGHHDKLRGISEATMSGSLISVGTGGDFKVLPMHEKQPSIIHNINRHRKSILHLRPSRKNILQHGKEEIENLLKEIVEEREDNSTLKINTIKKRKRYNETYTSSRRDTTTIRTKRSLTLNWSNVGNDDKIAHPQKTITPFISTEPLFGGGWGSIFTPSSPINNTQENNNNTHQMVLFGHLFTPSTPPTSK